MKIMCDDCKHKDICIMETHFRRCQAEIDKVRVDGKLISEFPLMYPPALRCKRFLTFKGCDIEKEN